MKSQYHEIVLPRFDDIKKWIEDGQNELFVCKKLGISKRTFENYKKEFPALSALLSRARTARNIVDVERTERALMKAITGGWEHCEGCKSVYVPPNFNAIQFALRNLKKNVWREDFNGETDGDKVIVNVNIKDCSKDDERKP